MTDRIAEIRQRLEAITRGDWYQEDAPELPFARNRVVSEIEALKPDVGSMKAFVPIAYCPMTTDAAFIASAPADMRYLLERLTAAQKVLQIVAERESLLTWNIDDLIQTAKSLLE